MPIEASFDFTVELNKGTPDMSLELRIVLKEFGRWFVQNETLRGCAL